MWEWELIPTDGFSCCTWGGGRGDARQWVMGLDAESRNCMIKSYCCVFPGGGGQRGKRRAEDVQGLAWGEEGWQLRIQPSRDPSHLTSLVLLSHAEGIFQNSQCWVHLHPSVPCILVMHMCAAFPLWASGTAAPPAGPGPSATLVWSGLCPLQAFQLDCRANTGEADRPPPTHCNGLTRDD